jgi:hypothetical protein
MYYPFNLYYRGAARAPGPYRYPARTQPSSLVILNMPTRRWQGAELKILRKRYKRVRRYLFL